MKKNISLILIAIFVFIYIVMYINTNSVIDDYKNIIMGNNVENIIETSALERYSVKHQTSNAVTDAKIDIKRILVLHNFFNGFMVVKYSYERFNDNGRINGSWGVWSVWKIQKQNNHWIVTDIYEKP